MDKPKRHGDGLRESGRGSFRHHSGTALSVLPETTREVCIKQSQGPAMMACPGPTLGGDGRAGSPNGPARFGVMRSDHGPSKLLSGSLDLRTMDGTTTTLDITPSSTGHASHRACPLRLND